MQIVIDIDEDYYKIIKHDVDQGMDYKPCVLIANGTPLPRHHGRLIDENKVIDEIVCEEIDGRYYDVIYAHSVYDAETIIEADEEEEK